MRGFAATAVLGCMVILLSACPPPAAVVTPPVVDVHAERQAIETLNARFQEAVNARDLETVAALYAPDAISMPPGQEPRRGIANIRSYYSALFAARNIRIEMEPTKIQVAAAGDMAYDIGRIRVNVTGTSPRTILGQYVSIWEKRNGQWVITREISNEISGS